MRILLVADSEVDYVVARELLGRASSRPVAIDWVDAHEVALRTLGRRRHDACVVDERVEGRTALDFLRAARAARSAVPIVVLHGSEGRDFGLDALSLGAADSVDKDGLDAVGLERAVRRAVERGRCEQELREQNQELLTLHRLSSLALRADASLEQAHQALVRATAEATGFPIVLMERHDARRGTMTLLAGCGPGSELAPPSSPAVGSLAGEVARTRRPRLEMGLDTPVAEAGMPWPEARTLVCLPMTVDERVIGTLTLAHAEARPVDSTQLNRAATIANHLALLVERVAADARATSPGPPTHGPAAL